jgi:hypothetical protein
MLRLSSINHLPARNNGIFIFSEQILHHVDAEEELGCHLRAPLHRGCHRRNEGHPRSQAPG